MSIKKKKTLIVLVLVLAIAAGAFAYSKLAINEKLYQNADDVVLSYNQGFVVNTSVVDGVECLFLPASVDASKLCLDFGVDTVLLKAGRKKMLANSNEEFDLSKFCTGNRADITLNGKAFVIMFSENIASMHITSKDPEKDRAWVELDKDNNKAKGSLYMINADGSVVYDGDLGQIKGRGNSTWLWAKKPYQIKLSDACDLMETGSEAESNKTWVLLANYIDKSLLRNEVSFALAKAVWLDYTPNYRPVDLYYDGEYRGTYLLTEKTEVGTGRVEVDEEQGFLLEMDYEARAVEEDAYFKTENGQCLVIKSPEDIDKKTLAAIAGLYGDFENAVYNGGVNSRTGKAYTDYVDLDSLVKIYLMEEFSQDYDAFASSNYIYKYDDSDLLYFGPIWDYDNGYGKTDGISLITAEGLLLPSVELCSKLLAIPSFQQAVKDAYSEYFYQAAKNISDNVIDQLKAEIEASASMNSLLWGIDKESLQSEENASTGNSKVELDNKLGRFQAEYEYLKNVLQTRNEYLKANIESWNCVDVPDFVIVDVPEDSEYYDAVRYVYNQKLMGLVGSGRFGSTENVGLVSALTVLYRAWGSPDVTGMDCPYSNVLAGDSYYKAIVWAYGNGLLSSSDTFEFKSSVSYGELKYMLTKLMNSDTPQQNVVNDETSHQDAWNGELAQLNLADDESIQRCHLALLLYSIRR